MDYCLDLLLGEQKRFRFAILHGLSNSTPTSFVLARSAGRYARRNRKRELFVVIILAKSTASPASRPSQVDGCLPRRAGNAMLQHVIVNFTPISSPRRGAALFALKPGPFMLVGD